MSPGSIARGCQQQVLAQASVRQQMRTRVQVRMASKHAAVLRQYAESQLVRRHNVALDVRVGLPRVLWVAIQRFACVQ